MNCAGGTSPSSGLCQRTQRLDADEPAAARVDLRLVVEDELFLLQPAAQLDLECQALGGARGHVLRVEQIRVRAGFAFLQRGLRVPEQRLGVRAVRGEHRDARLAGEAQLRGMRAERRRENATRPVD